MKTEKHVFLIWCRPWKKYDVKNLRLKILSNGFAARNCLWSQRLGKRSRCQKYLKLLQICHIIFWIIPFFPFSTYQMLQVSPRSVCFWFRGENSWPKLTTPAYIDLNLNWINYHMLCSLFAFIDDIFLNSVFFRNSYQYIQERCVSLEWDRALTLFKRCNEKNKSDSGFSQIGGLSSSSLFLKWMDAKVVRVCGDIGWKSQILCFTLGFNTECMIIACATPLKRNL